MAATGGAYDVDADAEGIGAAAIMIEQTGITVPALISFIAFNMTTIPCFAAVATAKAELGTKKAFRNTLIFWLITSYIVGTVVYLVGSWWWTLFILPRRQLVVDAVHLPGACGRRGLRHSDIQPQT